MTSPQSRRSYIEDSDYDDDDTISDISFDDVGKYYDGDDVIVASRTSSFSLTQRTPDRVESKSPARVVSPSSEGGKSGASSKQGTLRGVLIPCLQSNMLGAMMFMRLPWITSQTGVYLAFVTFILCLGSLLLTLLSLVAISTNGKIKKSGGLYVFVRKFLGLELGGSIGMLHLLQKILSASMHCLAASEAILTGFGIEKIMPHQTAVFAMLLCLVLSLVLYIPKIERRSEDFLNLFLGISVVTVISFAIGSLSFAAGSWNGALSSNDRVYRDNVHARYDDNTMVLDIAPSFFELLSLYYASSNGLMSASTRAGYLLSAPSRSIPLGSFTSVAVISVIMLFIIFTCGFSFSHDILRDEKFVLAMVAWPFPALVRGGIAAGCIGVALANLKGIPRLIGILDSDGAVPFFRCLFGQNHSHHDTTLATHIFSFLIVALPCLAGNMNYLAPYAALPSLLAYVAVNSACFLMTVINAPGFRPKWQYYSWHTALLGSVWCLGLMLVMSWWLSMLYIVLLIGLMITISHNTARNDWGDALSGLLYHQARNLLLYMADPQSGLHRAKNWRPQILIVSHIAENRRGNTPFRFAYESLIRLAGQMKMGKGLTMVAVLVEGDPSVATSEHDVAKEDLNSFMQKEGILGFTRFVVSKSLLEGSATVLQTAGIGSLEPNTVLCEWKEGLENLCVDEMQKNINMYRVVSAANKALVVVKGANYLPSNQARCRGNIDIWWVHGVHDGGLLLLLPHLLWLHKVWHHCRIRLFVVMTRPDDNPHKLKRRAEEHLDSERVDAVVEVVDLSGVVAGSDIYTSNTNDSARNRLLLMLNNPVTLSVALRNEHAHSGPTLLPQLSDIFKGKSPGEVQSIPAVHISASDIKVDTLLGHADMHTPASSPEKVVDGQQHELEDDGSDGGVASSNGIVGSIVSSDLSENEDDIEMGGRPPNSPPKRNSRTTGLWMQIAVQFNILIKQRSHDAKLVVLNLPPIMDMTDQDFVNYTNTLTNNIKPVLLVRGSGQEVITSYG